jgi:hypothetical protein
MSGRQRSLISLTVVAAIVTVVLLMARERPVDIAASGAAPEDTIDHCLERMLDAARNGDLESYLDCFAGELREQLAAGLAGQPNEKAMAELRSGEADLKSFATHPVVPPRDGEAVVTLERIYSRRHDLQRVTLRREGGAWKIVELVPVDRLAPPIPYGTPVVPEAGGDQSG